MKLPAFWGHPSLRGRIALSLVAAFLLVSAVLVGQDVLEFRDQSKQRKSLVIVAQSLVESLPEGDEQAILAVMKAAEIQTRIARAAASQSLDLADPEDILFLLKSASGRVVFASAALPAEKRQSDENEFTAVIGQQSYWTAHYANAHWRLQLFEPVIAERDVTRVSLEQLLPSLLWAFPIIWIVLQLTLWQGLRPLRRLVQTVIQRKPNDFSPIGLPMKYLELEPLVTAFDDLLSKARAGIERERTFVQDAAHELRTPLAVISAQAHLLTQAATADQRNRASSALEQAVSRASHLVHQLLTLATLEQTPVGEANTVELVAFIQNILIGLSPNASAKAIDLTLDTPDQAPMPLRSISAFHSILENLLNNAIAYSPRGARIQVTLEKSPDQVALTIADNGPGIAEGDRPYIFDRFYRGQQVTSRGSGLGLVIVRQAVHSLGGSLDIGPGLDGHGVSFTVRLGQGA